MLTFSAEDLAPGCAAVKPGERLTAEDISPALALEHLESFQGIPAVNLVDTNARILLSRGGREKLAIRNINGRLFVQVLPAATNDPVEQSPEEILQRLLDDPATGSGPASAGDSLSAPEPLPPVTTRRRWRESPWLLVAMLVLAAGLAYWLHAPTLPEGTTLIRDAQRLASLHAQTNGHYGTLGMPGAEVVTMQQGRITIHPAGATGPGGEPLLDRTYRFAERNGQVIVLVDNGAVFERDAAGTLRFGAAQYPRLTLPR